MAKTPQGGPKPKAAEPEAMEAGIPLTRFEIDAAQAGQLARAEQLDRDQPGETPDASLKATLAELGAELGFDPASAILEMDGDAISAIQALAIPALAEAEGARQNEIDGVAESETGGDRLEKAHQRGIDRLTNIADEMVDMLETENLGAGITAAMLELFKHRDKPWGQLIVSQQRDVHTAIDYAVKTAMRKAVRLVASQGRDAIRAKLEFYKDKAGTITASIQIAAADDTTILALHKASGKDVLIVTADVDEFMGSARDLSEDDQSELAFESSTADRPEPQPGPEGDRDLAGEDDDEEAEETPEAEQEEVEQES